MRTDYVLACETCHVYTAFVRCTFDADRWMAGAVDAVPTFVLRHVGHLWALRVISEDDSRWDEYVDESQPPLEGL